MDSRLEQDSRRFLLGINDNACFFPTIVGLQTRGSKSARLVEIIRKRGAIGDGEEEGVQIGAWL